MQMTDNLPVENKNILVVVAHPDDAESFCGGTISKLVRGGNRVMLVVCTNGDRGSHDRGLKPTDLISMRRQEQEQARQLLGIQEVIWLGYRDGELANITDLREGLIRLIRQLQPDIILTFDPWKHYEFHPDHRAVGYTTVEARMLADLPWVCPESTLEGIAPWHAHEMYLFAPEEANYWVDIAETIELKVQSRLAHRSQNDFIQCEQDVQAFIQEIMKSAEQACGNRYAEPFHKVDETNLWI